MDERVWIAWELFGKQLVKYRVDCGEKCEERLATLDTPRCESIEVIVADVRCAECSEWTVYDGHDYRLFVARQSKMYTQALLDIWLFRTANFAILSVRCI